MSDQPQNLFIARLKENARHQFLRATILTCLKVNPLISVNDFPR
jgi:hypothetical protein